MNLVCLIPILHLNQPKDLYPSYHPLNMSAWLTSSPAITNNLSSLQSFFLGLSRPQSEHVERDMGDELKIEKFTQSSGLVVSFFVKI
jgi:hypothetical protein